MRGIYATLACTQIFLALTFPRAYRIEKFWLLSILIATLFLSLLLKRVTLRGMGIFFFFTAFAVFHLISIMNGVINGNDLDYVVDGARLFVVFPIIFALLWSSLGDFDYGGVIHRIVIFSAVIIFAMNFIAIFENYFSLYILPVSFVEENLLRVGIHEGYVQLTSHNIGSIYFIFGYVLYYCLISDRPAKKEWFVLFLLTVLALASGRRGLWLALISSPFIFYFVKYLTNAKNGEGKKAPLFIFASLVLLVMLYFFTNQFNFSQFIERVTEAVSDDGGGIRKTQAILMFNDFINRPLLGSGIGGVINMDGEYRSTFELTYIHMLFNNGLIVTFFLALLIFLSFFKIYQAGRNSMSFCIVAQSMFFGMLLLLVGAITNPYLGSFDFLLMIGSIPFLASRGFALKNISQGG